jgi:PTH2 family peptidyl-tRNA hydrolase
MSIIYQDNSTCTVLFDIAFRPRVERSAQRSSPRCAMMVADTTKAFLAGALLPSIAFYFLRVRNKAKERVGGGAQHDAVGSGDDDSDDDDDDSAIFENVQIEPGALPCKEWGLQHAPYKMMLAVNTELSMGKGKMAAQCCHAAVGCYKRAAKQCPAALSAWERTGCAKIALKCPTADALEIIAATAMSKDIPFYLVEDAGRTQIAAGSQTVIGLFGPVSFFEGVTDHLKLM